MPAFPVTEKKAKALRERLIALRCSEGDIEESFFQRWGVELRHRPWRSSAELSEALRRRARGRGSALNEARTVIARLDPRRPAAPYRQAGCCASGRAARCRRSPPCRCRGCRRARSPRSPFFPAGTARRSMKTKSAGLPGAIKPAVELADLRGIAGRERDRFAGLEAAEAREEHERAQDAERRCTPGPPARPCRGSPCRMNAEALGRLASAMRAARSLPLWTISIAPRPCSRKRANAALLGSAVCPPLMWLITSRSASSTIIAADQVRARDRRAAGVDDRSRCRAVARPFDMFFASGPVFMVPSPISPMRFTPASASSA